MHFLKNFIKKITPSFLLDYYYLFLPFLGAVFYGFPSKKLFLIGVTGTGGKSTVVDFISRILEEVLQQVQGKPNKVASLSSIRFKIGEDDWTNTLKMTMPGRLKLQKFLRQAVNTGCKYAVLEVTSEGIKQHRHRFIKFDAAVFTNLSPEHIESHGGFENYRKAKGELFRLTKNIHILNLDDENCEYFLKYPAEEKWGYIINSKFNPPPNFGGGQNAKSPRTNSFGILRGKQFKIQNLLEAENIQCFSGGSNFIVNGCEFNLKLFGRFNIYNALAAICIGLSQGIPLEVCKKALEKIKGVPGRMEVVIRKPFMVIVDYAHTPDALEKVYRTLSSNIEHRTSNKLICVLGSAGGGRDKWKRPKMGEIAAKYCDEIIITNEDPYDENPNQILSEIKSGIFNFQFPISNFYEILDRREAIKKSLELAKEGDVVIITGKGCEPWLCVAGGEKIPWDDRQVVGEELKKLKIPLAP